MLLLLTGQRVFGAIGFVAGVFALALWGEGAIEMPFASTITLINWYPMLTLPMFVFMGYMLSESGIASDLYRMFHVWTGPMRGGLAVGTILLMVAISAMNGLSVAGMAIGATIALPELLKRGYDKIMVTGVIQAGSSLGIMIPPSVVLVLYGMIARQPVGQLWLAGVGPGLLMAALFILYIVIRCHLQPHLGPPLPLEERQQITWGEKIRLLRPPAAADPLLDDRHVRDGRHQHGRVVRRRRIRGHSGRGVQGPHHAQGAGRHTEEEPGRERHVHVDHPGGAGVRRGLRRPGCGQGG
jgi:TRAP-type mannitol/chloroaromatic compound transport system permease large subunit